MRKTITFSLSPALYDELNEEAKRRKLSSRSEFIRRLIREWRFVEREKIRLRRVRQLLEYSAYVKMFSEEEALQGVAPEGEPLPD